MAAGTNEQRQEADGFAGEEPRAMVLWPGQTRIPEKHIGAPEHEIITEGIVRPLATGPEEVVAPQGDGPRPDR